MSPTALNTLAALAIAALLSTSYMLDGPDDIATAQAVADDLHQPQQDAQQDAQKEAQQLRFAKAASAICGQNAAWSVADDGRAIQCSTKRGHRTQKVAL